MLTPLRIRAFAFMLLALVTAAAAYQLQPTTYLTAIRGQPDLERIFPRSFGDWREDTSMPAQLVAPDAQELIAKLYDQTLSRTYVNSKGQRIMLSVAYGGDQSDGNNAHRPEVCYPSQGFEMLEAHSDTMQLDRGPLPVRELVAKLGNRVEPISYWIVVGDYIALTGTQQKLAQLRYTMKGIIPDGMLVRVSNISVERPQSFSLHRAFVAQMLAAMTPEQVSRVVGSLRSPGASAARPQDAAVASADPAARLAPVPAR